MKKILLLVAIAFPLLVHGQAGIITTYAGTGTAGYSGDGGAATAARISYPLGIASDAGGSFYICADGRIRKINASGIVTTWAGGGSSTGDGIAATSASINAVCIVSDITGNIYFADGSRIRKVASSTGIITTVAGTGATGYTGDGGPATAAKLNSPQGICFDASGNMYIGDEGNSVVRKVTISGIISTYAGNGSSGFSGDGGQATNAQLQGPDGVTVDADGNLYVADGYDNRIRKINPSGIISTYAGNGSSGGGGDGGAATAASFNIPYSVSMDYDGNLYVADVMNARIRKVSKTGVVNTYAGGGSATASGIPATSAALWFPEFITADRFSNIYISDNARHLVRRVGGNTPAISADSFSIYINSTCSGVTFYVIPSYISPSLTAKTWFGDGTVSQDTFSMYTGVAAQNHFYSTSGNYTIKTVLFNGTTAIDSVLFNYSYSLCNNIPVTFYFDGNTNCVKDSGDVIIAQPVLVQVDSNGMHIDTISATAGLFYNAYGNPGDVYAFRIIGTPLGLYPTCPSTGIVYDTISSLPSPQSSKYIGLGCTTSSSFDLSVHAIIPVTGVDDQWANVYVQNNGCTPVTGTVTFNYSPKYVGGAYPILPAPTSSTGNTIIWNIPVLSSTSSAPAHLYYAIWSGSTHLTIGDTVQSHFVITPVSGDADTSNNTEVIIDTVRAGCDPNAIYVKPGGCIASGASPTQLQYTITFENTGNDTAHNIYVMDTLPSYVDPSSMRLVMASHEMYTSKLKDAAGHTILKFDFPNINLLDSSHHGLCDGAVIYTINTRPGLATGTDIMNRAGIYFDVNDVVMTNRVDNIIGCWPSSVSSLQSPFGSLRVYPNPAYDVLNIEIDNVSYQSFTITNSIGSTVLTKQVSNVQTQVNIKLLPAGLYYVTLKGEHGNEVRKFVKM